MSAYFMNVKNVRHVQYVGIFHECQKCRERPICRECTACMACACVHNVLYSGDVQHVRNVQNIYRVPNMSGMCIISGTYRVQDVGVRPLSSLPGLSKMSGMCCNHMLRLNDARYVGNEQYVGVAHRIA